MFSLLQTTTLTSPNAPLYPRVGSTLFSIISSSYDNGLHPPERGKTSNRNDIPPQNKVNVLVNYFMKTNLFTLHILEQIFEAEVKASINSLPTLKQPITLDFCSTLPSQTDSVVWSRKSTSTNPKLSRCPSNRAGVESRPLLTKFLS